MTHTKPAPGFTPEGPGSRLKLWFCHALTDGNDALQVPCLLSDGTGDNRHLGRAFQVTMPSRTVDVEAGKIHEGPVRDQVTDNLPPDVIVLAVISLSLLLVVGATVGALIPFYASGVFTGFAMAGFGMARYLTVLFYGRRHIAGVEPGRRPWPGPLARTGTANAPPVTGHLPVPATCHLV